MSNQNTHALKSHELLLIFDQDCGVLHELEDDLEKNYTVLHATSIEKASQHLYESQIQILLCNEQILEAQKDDFLELLKSRFPHVTLLLFSRALNHEMEQALNHDSPIKFFNTSTTLDLDTALKQAKDQYNLFSANQDTDFLTKLKNTLALQSVLDQEIRRSRRYKRSLSCVMVDVDQLKLINDKHGFVAGDQVLKEVADTLQNKVRESDHLGRLREDNFLAVLPECGEDEVHIFVKRCTDVLNQMELDAVEHPVSFSVTVSYLTIPFDTKISVAEVLKILNERNAKSPRNTETPHHVQLQQVTQSVGKLNMLIVDDEENILASLKALFRKDYYVTTASSSEKALSLIESEGKIFSLILCDQRMGGMQGNELLRILNERYDDDMIGIMLTGYSDLESVTNAINEGHIYAYITKPWEVHELKDVVRNCDRIFRLRRENKLLTRNLMSVNAQLEDRVKQRTKDLERVNSELQGEIKERERVEVALRDNAKELLQKHEDLKRTQSQLVQAAKLSSLGEMATSIAHEINQPLQIIRLSVEIMERHMKLQEHDRIASKLKMVIDQVDRASKITNHMRTFGRDSESTEMKLISLNNVVENTFTLIQHQLMQFSIQLTKSLDEELPEIVANPLHLEQVLVNLISNARDALEHCKTKVIEIRTSFDADHVVMEVSDNGSGIPDDVKERIFDPFFTTKEVGKGTGLGMSISYGLIQDHGGSILVDSKLNEGTTFTIKLPRGTLDSEH